MTRITCTLHEHQYIFVTIPRSTLLRMRSVWDKSRRENQNTYFMLNYYYFFF